MGFSKQIAQHIREVHFGGNWTDSCLKDQLKDLSWQEAKRQVGSFNSISTLVYHMNYYIVAVSKVLEGLPLEAKDRLSFEVPDINSREAWEQMLQRVWDDAEKFAALVEILPDKTLFDNMADEKYGSLYRNLQGIVEHFHYHLGQIVLIKKLVVDSQ